MSIPRRVHGRAAALLFALIAVVLMGMLAANFLRMCQDRQRIQAVSSSQARIHQMAPGVERQLLAWLEQRGDRLVFPPVGGPLPVVADRIWGPAERLEVRVDLYDRCGMRSPGMFRPGYPWEGEDFPEVTQAEDWYEQCPQTLRRHRFPELASVAWTEHGIWTDRGPDGPDGREPEPDSPTGDGDRNAWATLVDPWGSGRLNVNTAPIEILERAIAFLGGQGADALRLRRDEGTWSQALATLQTRPDFVLVDRSERWACMCEIATDRGQRLAWWAIIDRRDGRYQITRRYLDD